MKQVVKKLYPVMPFVLSLLFIILFFSIIRTSVFGYVPEEKHIFFEITFLLLLAVLAESVMMYLKQPSVMILLLLGVVMSKGFLGIELIKSEEVIRVFAQLGAIFLLFKVGLHSHIKKVFSRENLVVAVLGVVVPFAAGYLYASFTGGNFAYSMFLGAALTATSVGVTVAILKEAKMLGEKFAEVIIGAAVIDDILGLLVLSFVVNAPGSISIDALLPVAKVFASSVVFLAGGVILGERFVRNIIDGTQADSKNFLLVISFLLLYAYVAEYIGLSSIVGAFLAGVLLNYSRHIRFIEEKTYALEVLFTPIFFISLGMLVDLNSVAGFLAPIVAISVIAILTKIIGCGIGALMAGLKRADSVIVGIGMSPRGEVALIIALFGLTKGVLSDSEYSIIVAMALLTTLATPPILNYLIKKRSV